MSSSLDTDSSPYIGVPSRVYDIDADLSKLPLAGIRITVKDIYFSMLSHILVFIGHAFNFLDLVQGIRASAGNRAFYALNPPRNATGPAITRLLDTGGHVIGSTKTVQFANGDRATAVRLPLSSYNHR